MARTAKMTQGSIAGALVCYALPLILGNFFQLTYNAVDAVIIGKLIGEQALAAVSAANPVMTVFILGVSGISIGASMLMSRFFGAGDAGRLRREAATTLLFGAAASLALLVPGLLFAPGILRLLNVPQDILALATAYLRVVFLAFPFTFLYNVLSACLRSVGDSRTPVVFLTAASVLNACADIVLVSRFGWGVCGVGLTTVLAQAASCALCFAYMQRRVPLLRLGRVDLRVDGALLRLTLESGIVTALQQACQPVGKVLIQSVINAQGITAIAAFNAVSRVDDFACIPEQSISSAMMTCMAQNRGAGRNDRARATLSIGLRLEVFYGVSILLLVQLFKTPVMRLFAAQDSPGMLETGVDYLSLMAFFYVLPGLTNGMQGFFRGMGEMRTTLAATFIQISIRVLVVYLLVPRIGLRGAAWACAIGWSAMLAFACARCRRVVKELG